MTLPSPRSVAVIGTAGRDGSMPLTRALWHAMVADVHSRVQPDDMLVSGGAAWADHLAVHAYLNGWCQSLKLYLPAPLQAKQFVGPRASSASAANYYHQRFRQATGVDGLKDIEQALTQGAQMSFEPPMAGYGGMFARNKKVALAATAVLAYTFGEGDAPADGGTMNTWRQIQSLDRVHIPLNALLQAHQCRPVADEMPSPREGRTCAPG